MTTRARRSRVKSQYYPFAGGLNLVDPQISMTPGMLIAGKNYEGGVRGGYRRIDGYERFDGRLSPSDATYWLLRFDAGNSTAIAEGDIVRDAATPSDTIAGEVLATPTLTSGSWGAGAAGYMILGKVEDKLTPDNFDDNDTLWVGSSQLAIANGTAAERAALTAADDETHYQDAIETLRNKISAPTGGGSVLGVVMYKGDVYCFRDSGGNAVMYKATTSGWTAVDLGGFLNFTTGSSSAEPLPGRSMIGATSGRTATITKVVTSSGTWAGNDAAGVIWYVTKSGAFTSGETFNQNGGTPTFSFNMTGSETDTALTQSGKYRFEVANFLGSAGTEKLYGVDGVNKAFEYDGTGFIQITTGMTTDTPIFVKEHKSHLMLFFAGGSVQSSSIRDPHTWSVVTGASEIATADEITGVSGLPGDVLLVANRNRMYVLYGSASGGSDPWQLDEHADTTGCVEDSLQRLGNAHYLDDRGMIAFRDIEAYGNFEDATFSQQIQPELMTLLDNVVASTVSRCKNQYRIFFDRGDFPDEGAFGYYVTMDNRRVSAIMPVTFADTMTCIVSEENNAGVEEIYFGSENGFVYQLDKGTSFDGASVPAYIRPAFNHLGSPHLRKAIKGIEAEVITEDDPTGRPSTATTKHVPSFSYEDGDAASHRVDEASIQKTTTQNPLNVLAQAFDGTSDWLSASSMTGSANGKQLTCSFWAKRTSPSSGTRILFRAGASGGAATGEFIIEMIASGRLNIDGRVTGGTTLILEIGTADGIPDDGMYHHVAFSVDLATTTAHAYVDGVSSLTTATLTDDTLDFTHDGWTVCSSFNGIGKLDIVIAEFYFALEYLDLSVASNLAKFRDGDDPKPNLGSDGSDVTGTQPLIYLTRQFGNTFESNAGSGGAFTVNGVPEADAFELVPVDVTRPRITMDSKGTGQNFSATLYSRKIYEEPQTIYGATVYYLDRRRKRGLGV